MICGRHVLSAGLYRHPATTAAIAQALQPPRAKQAGIAEKPEAPVTPDLRSDL